jgi:hypothetical protein
VTSQAYHFPHREYVGLNQSSASLSWESDPIMPLAREASYEALAWGVCAIEGVNLESIASYASYMRSVQSTRVPRLGSWKVRPIEAARRFTGQASILVPNGHAGSRAIEGLRSRGRWQEQRSTVPVKRSHCEGPCVILRFLRTIKSESWNLVIQSIVVGYLESNIQKRIGSVVPRENTFVDNC